ncbi:bifunctional DNA primase/polymerase [Streptomyces sp. XY511]|uniref:bifunctional DNA primase/polymerase n=1 Tax=Streptomyces sp. XY511 TaxID=1519480 RepID=UPI000B0CE15D|nr:bifunctional DNA primase/polymerase [Streptomyces sp. XY511]
MLTPNAADAAAVADCYRLAVFPLQRGGRRPAVAGWQDTASADPEALRSWPDGANIGIACRRSRLVVLDLDVKGNENGVEVFTWHLDRRRERWPDTLTVTTPSGGCHVYYRARAGWTVPSSSGGRTRMGPGIDVRAPGRRLGGYVIGPNSIVDGKRYDVAVALPVQTLPVWVAQLIGGRRGNCF